MNGRCGTVLTKSGIIPLWLEPISKITPEQQHDAGELHHGEKVVEQVFVAGDELAPVLKPGVGTFNLPPTFV